MQAEDTKRTYTLGTLHQSRLPIRGFQSGSEHHKTGTRNGVRPENSESRKTCEYCRIAPVEQGRTKYCSYGHAYLAQLDQHKAFVAKRRAIKIRYCAICGKLLDIGSRRYKYCDECVVKVNAIKLAERRKREKESRKQGC